MTDRPQNLIYALNDKPPARVIGVLALQHMVLSLMLMMYPVILAVELGMDAEATHGLVTTAILAAGLFTILQASRIGSGFLAVAIPNPIVLPTFIAAARASSFGAACGTMAVCFLMQMGLARLLPRLRAFFPPEVCGVAVMMLGISLVKGGVGRFTGFDAASMAVDPRAIMVGFSTLGPIMLLSVWAKGSLRLYAMLLGCAIGYAVAWALGLLGPEVAERIAAAPAVALPMPAIPPLSFHVQAFLPLFVGMLLSMLDAVGCIITLDKMNKAHWARTEMPTISRGIFADGVVNTLASIGGTLGVGFSSANIGLAFASGVTSRIVGMVTGVLLIAAAFVPKLATLLALMPAPVVGAVLIFTAACLITSGMELIMSRLLNDRRMLLIGLSTAMGISVAALPGLYAGVPDWAAPLFHSELTLAALVALVLNIIFRIGVAQRASLVFEPGVAPLGALYDFMEAQGANWGARRDVVQRATLSLVEATGALVQAGLSQGPLTVEASFDELNLNLRLTYAGQPLVLEASKVNLQSLLDDDSDTGIDDVMRSVSAGLIAHLADRCTSSARGGEATLMLHFDH